MSDLTPKTSYLQDYPNPLGRFKFSTVFLNVRPKLIDIQITNSKFLTKGNISWQHVYLSDHEAGEISLFRMGVNCKVNIPERGAKWHIRANISLTLHCWTSEDQSINLNYEDYWFDNLEFENNYLLDPDGISIERLLDENSGFLKNGNIRIDSDIRVLEVSGFYQPTVFNYHVAPLNPIQKFCVKFTNFEMYCNKAILQAHIDCEIVAKTHKTIFHDVSRGSFEEFLDAFHGHPLHFNGRGYFQKMLETARNLPIRSFSLKAEHSAIHTNCSEIVAPALLEIALEYNLRRIVHNWLGFMKKVEKSELEKLQVDKLSGEIMKAILKRVMHLKMEEEKQK